MGMRSDIALAAGAGRPTALTPALAAVIVATHRQSSDFRNVTALRCGIDPKTLRTWIHKGLSEAAPEPYFSFARDFIVAEADLREQYLARLLSPGVTKAEVAALTWYVERRFRQWRADYVPGPTDADATGIPEEATVGAQFTPEQKEQLILRLLEQPTTQMQRLLDRAGYQRSEREHVENRED